MTSVDQVKSISYREEDEKMADMNDGASKSAYLTKGKINWWKSSAEHEHA